MNSKHIPLGSGEQAVQNTLRKSLEAKLEEIRKAVTEADDPGLLASRIISIYGTIS